MPRSMYLVSRVNMQMSNTDTESDPEEDCQPRFNLFVFFSVEGFVSWLAYWYDINSSLSKLPTLESNKGAGFLQICAKIVFTHLVFRMLDPLSRCLQKTLSWTTHLVCHDQLLEWNESIRLKDYGWVINLTRIQPFPTYGLQPTAYRLLHWSHRSIIVEDSYSNTWQIWCHYITV